MQPTLRPSLNSPGRAGGKNVSPPFFQTPDDNGPFFTFFYTPTRHPPLPRAQHGAEHTLRDSTSERREPPPAASGVALSVVALLPVAAPGRACACCALVPSPSPSPSLAQLENAAAAHSGTKTANVPVAAAAAARAVAAARAFAARAASAAAAPTPQKHRSTHSTTARSTASKHSSSTYVHYL